MYVERDEIYNEEKLLTNSIVRLLDLVKFFLPVLPEVEFPFEKVSLDEKIIYTVSCGIIFLVGQLPLYGLKPNAFLYIQDPFYQFRSIFAMEKGTLLELGLLPAVTAAFLWQVGASFKLINVNLTYRSERELFQTGQKLTGLFLAVVYLLGLFSTNYFDESIKNHTMGSPIAISSMVLLFVQIIGMSFFSMIMIEIIDKGYGFGSGILCLLTIQYATNFVKDVAGLEIVPLRNSNKSETSGALFSLIKNFSFSFDKLSSNIINAFTRVELANLTQFYIVIFAILAVIALNNFRIELSIRSNKARSMSNIYPIKLLYTGCLPVLFSVTVLANVQVFGYFISSALLNKYPIVSKLLANYQLVNSNLTLTNGILYYLSCPSSIFQALLNPLRTFVFATVAIVSATWFANFWSLISGSAPKDLAKQFKEQGVSIAGKRDISVTKELSRIIPVASVSGAFITCVVAILGEALGANGRAFGAIIGICSAFNVLEEFMLETQQGGGSSQLLGALSQYQ